MSRRDAQVITAIWLVTLFAFGWIVGEDTTVEEEVYGTILFLIVGSVATGVYLLVRETRMKKKTGRLSLSTDGNEQTTTPSQGRRSSAWWGVLDVFVVVFLWFVGTAIAWNLGVPDYPSLFVGALLPLAFLLARQMRRSRALKSRSASWTRAG